MNSGDSLDHSLQPTDTCQVLLTLEGDGQLLSTSQLEPTRPASPPQVAPVAPPTQATVLPAMPPDPPSRKKARPQDYRFGASCQRGRSTGQES
ncbi:hypothetical protein HPB47_016960 [Ixodes persulcatus]|uniref:Uncharacterized protein n=1 Tax=Ixodes persulcatus TaxID=34615 RepID=A0AC60QQJ5_IXOPE|nr:hypothetical protein HPB47_016960 [Ixodes persulcatus]